MRPVCRSAGAGKEEYTARSLRSPAAARFNRGGKGRKGAAACGALLLFSQGGGGEGCREGGTELFTFSRLRREKEKGSRGDSDELPHCSACCRKKKRESWLSLVFREKRKKKEEMYEGSFPV